MLAGPQVEARAIYNLLQRGVLSSVHEARELIGTSDPYRKSILVCFDALCVRRGNSKTVTPKKARTARCLKAARHEN
jgi:hypothetical protein